jgi:hypothetical protein
VLCQNLVATDDRRLKKKITMWNEQCKDYESKK